MNMNFPGYAIKKGEKDKAIVRAIQQQLNLKGCGPLAVDGVFGNKTLAVLKLFQARFLDQQGQALKIDGEAGPITWAALFGYQTIDEKREAINPLSAKALEIAASQIGTSEKPPGSNNGSQINQYQDAAGVPHGLPWCMAFVYWCFNEASKNMGRTNPVLRTGGVLDQWNRAKCLKILSRDAISQPSLVAPGQIFIISTGQQTGHTGLVEKVHGGILTTIEGNTNEGGSREGIGVFRRTSRKINSINRGFLAYE